MWVGALQPRHMLNEEPKRFGLDKNRGKWGMGECRRLQLLPGKGEREGQRTEARRWAIPGLDTAVLACRWAPSGNMASLPRSDS